jgi:CheY-like chemotaxis protein/HPt (histidine-containing phosphotransfer) domain-containing protein
MSSTPSAWSPAIPPSFQEHLAALKRQYVEQLPDKVADMQRILDTLLDRGWNQELGETLHRNAHSLAGSGGTMGLPEVGSAARRLEQCLKSIVQGQAQFTERGAEVRTLLGGLADVVTHTSPPPASAESDLSAGPDPLQQMGKIKPMRILVVDDDAINRMLLGTLLRADGHEVFTAEDGVQGVVLFEEIRPDLVFMDVLMPNMNGYDAATRIKAASGNEFTPLIFLTALKDEEDLARCIASGGDDFIVKPYNRVLLKSKLIAMQRIRELHKDLVLYQQRTAEEIALSRHVFEAVTHRNPVLDAVQHCQAVVGHFSGDLLLYGRSPTGRLLLLFGDFTGHGLSAALAAVPVSDLFYALVEDEVALPDLVLAINRKLKSVLPTGHYCAAVLADIDPARQRMSLWNGGIPGVYLLDAVGGIRRAVPSSKLPLGIIGDRGFDAQTEVMAYQRGDGLLCFSDGLSEARREHGEMFGQAAVEAQFAGSQAGLIDRLRSSLSRHMDGSQAEDDISVVLVSCEGLVAETNSGPV